MMIRIKEKRINNNKRKEIREKQNIKINKIIEENYNENKKRKEKKKEN